MTSPLRIWKIKNHLLQSCLECHLDGGDRDYIDKVTETNLQNLDENTLNLLLENQLYPLEIEDKPFSFDVAYPDAADDNVNVGATCPLHTAIVMLSHLPFVKEALKDYLECSDEEYIKTQGHRKEYKEMFQAIYDYLNTGKRQDFQKIVSSCNRRVQNEDADEILVCLIIDFDQNMRIKFPSIFTACPLLFKDKLRKTKTNTEIFLHCMPIKIKAKGEDVGHSINRYLHGCKIPPGTEPPFFFIERYKTIGSQQDILEYGRPIFNQTHTTITKNENEYRPLAVAENTGGHYRALANNINNVENNDEIYVFDDTLSTNHKIDQKTAIRTPTGILFYNRNFFQKQKANPASLREMLKNRIQKFPREAKIIALVELIYDNLQAIIEQNQPVVNTIRQDDNKNEFVEQNKTSPQEATNNADEEANLQKTHQTLKIINPKNNDYVEQDAKNLFNLTINKRDLQQHTFSQALPKTPIQKNNNIYQSISYGLTTLPPLKSNQIQNNSLNTKLPSSNIRTTQQQNLINSQQNGSQTPRQNNNDNEKQSTLHNDKIIATLLTLAGIGAIVGGFFVRNKNITIAICLFCLGGVAIIAGIICFAKDFGNDKPINNLPLKQNLNNVSNSNQSLPIQ